MRKLLIGVLMLTLAGGCKKTMEKLEQDTQIQEGDNPKPMVHLTGVVTNPNGMMTTPNGTNTRPPTTSKEIVVTNKKPTPRVPMPMPVAKNGGGSTTVQPGSGGVVQNVRNAVRRTVSLNEFNNLKLFIETASVASGEMPPPALIVESIGRDLPNLTAAIQEGSVVLTGIRQREGVWAYEKAALENNGVVLSNNGVERMNAAQLKQMLMGQ